MPPQQQALPAAVGQAAAQPVSAVAQEMEQAETDVTRSAVRCTEPGQSQVFRQGCQELMGRVCNNGGQESPGDEGKDALDDACELFFLLEKREDAWWAQPPPTGAKEKMMEKTTAAAASAVDVNSMMSAPAPGALAGPAPAPGPAPGPFVFDMDEGRALPTQGFQGPFVEHNNYVTQTGDWRAEFGPNMQGPSDIKEICKLYPGNEWCKFNKPQTAPPTPAPRSRIRRHAPPVVLPRPTPPAPAPGKAGALGKTSASLALLMAVAIAVVSGGAPGRT